MARMRPFTSYIDPVRVGDSYHIDVIYPPYYGDPPLWSVRLLFENPVSRWDCTMRAEGLTLQSALDEAVRLIEEKLRDIEKTIASETEATNDTMKWLNDEFKL